ncbi:hypothetical protein TWF694_005914 [Orbilia ellipsospora]|uniref:Biogenesis of lysosome-related organelles complex 1 subunit 6 n=1 Tax=Orbilia ellipsospora TaxID=2528407 RepID=A0AAV9WSD5_9PEZI
MEPESGQNAASSSSLGDIDSLTSVYADATVYLSKLASQLEELETTQTALLHSYHATSTALADIRSYNTVSPVMDLIPTYTAKVARLKQLMMQQKMQVDKMKARAEEVRRVKKGNAEKMKRRWEEERERDKGIAARVVGSAVSIPDVGGGEVSSSSGVDVGKGSGGSTRGVGSGNGKAIGETSLSPRSQEEGRLEAVDTPEPSSSKMASVPAVKKTIVKRKKKARQAEIE